MDAENSRNEIEIDLRGLFTAILNRMMIIILVGILVGGIVFAYTEYFVDEQYVAKTKVYILTHQDPNSEGLTTNDLAFATYLANDYQVLLTSDPVLQEVIDEKSNYWYKDILFKSPDTYRFINSMYYLSKNAASNGYGATKENFKKFLKEFAGANVFANFVKSTNKSSLGEASVSKIKGDLNLDKKVNSTDIIFADRYFADNYNANNNGLSPEGAFNFDMNSDGYINQEDLNQLKKLAK